MKKNGLRLSITVIGMSLLLNGCSLNLNRKNIIKDNPVRIEITNVPTSKQMPTNTPTNTPTATPTAAPTATPTVAPTVAPTATPTSIPATENKIISLTFDDGPSKYTNDLLDLLKIYGIKATFFVVEYNVEYYADTLRRAYEEGHEICVHGYTHESFVKLGQKKTIEEILRTKKALENIGIEVTNAVRPPYGNFNKEIGEAIKSIRSEENKEDNLTIPVITWNVDSRDWENKDPDEMTKIVLKEVGQCKEGSIILFHDTYETTILGVGKTISSLLKQGYTFEPVMEAFTINNKEILDGEKYRKTR